MRKKEQEIIKEEEDMQKIAEITESISLKEMLNIQMSKLCSKDYAKGKFEVETNSSYQDAK